jgi:hypothetical protein
MNNGRLNVKQEFDNEFSYWEKNLPVELLGEFLLGR